MLKFIQTIIARFRTFLGLVSFGLSNQPAYGYTQGLRQLDYFHVPHLANPQFYFCDHHAIRIPALKLQFLS